MTKHKFIIITILLLGLLTLINFNIKNVYANDLQTNFQNPNTFENIDYLLGKEFINLDNSQTQNDQYTTSNCPKKKNTDYLRVSEFNFEILDGSIIKGIEVRIDDYGELGDPKAQNVYLVLNNNPISIDREFGTFLSDSDTDTYRTYGSSTDMWNTELIESDIESSTFGIQISYTNPQLLTTRMIYIDHIQIKVYYSISDIDVSNIDFIIIFSLLGIFSIMILILMFSILIIKR